MNWWVDLELESCVSRGRLLIVKLVKCVLLGVVAAQESCRSLLVV